MILSPGNELAWGEWLPAVKHTTNNLHTPLQKLEEVEKNHISEVLKQLNWKVSGENGAAKFLGLNPTTLEARMKKLGIKRG
jgi:transcriptional regulator with GAF, ATPase, and Fis domain